MARVSNSSDYCQRLSIIAIGIIIVYFVWLDILLYHYVQNHDISTYPPTPKPIPDQTTLYSPFAGFSVKMVMEDHASNYVFAQLATNMISAIGVVFACIASRFMLYEDIKMHRVSVLIFQMRIFADGLDGLVARKRRGLPGRKEMSVVGSSGFYADAVCDTIGVLVLIAACYVNLRKYHHKRSNYQYLPLKNMINNEDDSKVPGEDECTIRQLFNLGVRKMVHIRTSFRPVTIVVVCFLVSMGLTAIMWNRYIEKYRVLLETIPTSEDIAAKQNEVFHSSVTWTLMWFWKVSCGHSLTNMLLAAIFLNKLWEFLTWIQWIGIIHLLVLGFFTEMHINGATQYILS